MRFIRHLTLSLAVVLGLQAPFARAEVIGADAAPTEQSQQQLTQAEKDRAKVRKFVEEASLKDRMRALGVDSINAQRRIDAMTHEEVHALAQKIDAMPAGGALSDTDIILILLVTLLLIVAL